ncbi:alpha/beta fold hydrolase [Streptomyces albus subsp. chlorinus]|nr:alpha/beta fold hydrolase [Streptomyces albus subsp. chlorinus]
MNRTGKGRARAGRSLAVGLLAGAAVLAASPVPGQASTPEPKTGDAGSVKSSAAGPVAGSAGDLSRFVAQRPEWKKCGHKELDEAGARCATIRVPLDYRHPEGRTLTLGFSRIKAEDTEHRIGLMMHNSGGPGGITLDMPLMDEPVMGKKLAGRFDLIGMDPRGVGRSSPLHCGTKEHWLRSAGYDEAGFRAQAASEKELVRACQRVYGKKMPYLRHFTTRNTARDMDLLRAVLGERRTSYFGISYGTYLGAVYAKMFPQRVDRLLLDSAIDPARWHVQGFRDATAANEEFLDAWSAWAARRNGTYGLGDTPREVRATVDGIARKAAREPLKVGEYTADGQEVAPALAMAMYDDREFARAGKSIKVLHEASLGRPVRPTEDLKAALGPPEDEQDVQNSLQMALMCADRAAPRDLSWYRRNVERSRAGAPLHGPLFNGVNPCAFWPVEPLEPPVTTGNAVPGLIVQATGDPRTSYANGQGLHRKMPNSRLITFKARVHGVYGIYPNRCVEKEVNSYLSTGRLPAGDPPARRTGGEVRAGGHAVPEPGRLRHRVPLSAPLGTRHSPVASLPQRGGAGWPTGPAVPGTTGAPGATGRRPARLRSTAETTISSPTPPATRPMVSGAVSSGGCWVGSAPVGEARNDLPLYSAGPVRSAGGWETARTAADALITPWPTSGL